MKILPINIGEMKFTDELKDGKGIRIARSFLQDLAIGFAKKSRKYFDVTSDLPYVYTEKQLHSILIPIIDKLSEAFLVEKPTERKKVIEKSSHGWIDYWVNYKNIIFLIELKYSCNGYSNISKLRNSSLKEWINANKQLDEIPNPKAFALNNETVIKIALQFNLTYTGSKKIQEFSIEDCIEVGDKIKASMAKEKLKPDFISNWYVHEDMIGPYEFEDDYQERYPYIHMFAKINQVSHLQIPKDNPQFKLN